MRTNPLGSAGARCRHAEEHWVHTRPAVPPRLPSHPLLSLAGRLQVPVDALRLAGLEPNTEDRVEQRLGRWWPKAAAIGGFRQAPERRRSLSPARMRRGLASRVKRIARCKRAGLWSGGRAAWAVPRARPLCACAHRLDARMATGCGASSCALSATTVLTTSLSTPWPRRTWSGVG